MCIRDRFDAAGWVDVKLFTVIWGRPLRYAQVMPILKVRAVIWFGASVNLTVPGLFLPRNWMAGKSEGASTPTVKGRASQDDMRTSCGCIWVILSPLRRPAGVPSQSPTRKITEGAASVEARFSVVVIPAVTATGAAGPYIH